MSLSKILFILVKYIEYDTLNNISEVIYISDYIWNLFFINKYKNLPSSKDNAERYHRNSLPFYQVKTNEDRSYYDYMIIIRDTLEEVFELIKEKTKIHLLKDKLYCKI